ncbi:taurine catabolism dioxygenase TauD, TfdA family protein [Sphaerosporella brunnea]|uniref:Taurine catabolism dioxygenase TauD, TfdA family protein n=1 Tax=Sphaerosporella brunnea TaxID=1250544 RepID=A0A5J5F6S8_9PEZI|nr:taurine catabolism dioxygenase TauD, TfdA family protein [Sphaerosporella brunnea]
MSPPPSALSASPPPAHKKELTSGQHSPLFSQLLPWTQFPAEITGRTVWERRDYVEHPEKWVHVWTPEQVAEIEAATEAYVASGRPLVEITRESFPLPTVRILLERTREDLVDGKGFALFKGLPVEEWGVERSAVAYMGLGTYVGHFLSQNAHGHVLGHVKDLFEDSSAIDRVRIYRTNARQYFHSDDSDVVGLLCLSRALSGGESDIASSHRVYNVLRRRHPAVLETLSQPIWHFDRKGEVSRGQAPYLRAAVFYCYRGRVISKWDPYFVRSVTRFVEQGLVPPLTPAQEEAMKVLEETCVEESLHMVLDVGDLQWVSNNHVFHARTAYTDHPPPAKRRHLLRLWLSTPESEGGWELPFWDSAKEKRGGIQVDEMPEVAPLDAE